MIHIYHSQYVVYIIWQCRCHDDKASTQQQVSRQLKESKCWRPTFWPPWSLIARNLEVYQDSSNMFTAPLLSPIASLHSSMMVKDQTQVNLESIPFNKHYGSALCCGRSSTDNHSKESDPRGRGNRSHLFAHPSIIPACRTKCISPRADS